MNFRETEAYTIFLKQLFSIRPTIENIDEHTIKSSDVKMFLHALKGNAGLFGFNELGLLAQEFSQKCEAPSAQHFILSKNALLLAIDEVLKEQA